jgi:thiol-disulfide isomerase/thioredoxin
METTPRVIVAAAALAVIGTVLAVGQGEATFTLEPKGAVTAKLGYYPVPVPPLADKPAQVKKEPAYRAKPTYGILRVGDGPKNDFVVAFDEPADADWKVYIDKNRNGDLTDDGDGDWKAKRTGERAMYGVLEVPLRASYGTATTETSSSEYTIAMYKFVQGARTFIYRQSSRVGNVVVNGKSHKAILVENDANALFNKPVEKKEDAGKTRAVWLMVDLADDGKYSSGQIDIRAPFAMADGVFEATISNDGSKVKIAPTTKPVLELTPKRAAPQPLLKAGDAAPEFTCEKWGGGELKLSDYRGKVVILDFWATWCGPCQKSMPHIESVNKGVKGQDVVVLAVCVWDDKAAYEGWVPKNQTNYTFQFAFDPAARDNAASIATKLFHVGGIPTTYIIDKDGKVSDAIVGYSDGDKRVEDALKKLGVKVASN